MSNTFRDKVFISYSHKDAEWLQKIKIHLKSLPNKNKILIWDDTKIEAGEMWRSEIAESLDGAKVALLLVSPNFLASDFIAEHELPKILEASKKEGLKILWVCVSWCNFDVTEIANYQATNDPATPLDKMEELSPPDLNKFLTNLCKLIAKKLDEPLHPNLPDKDEELDVALTGIVQAENSPYGSRGILRRYLRGTIYLITEKGTPPVKFPPIENNKCFRVNYSLTGERYESLGGTGSKLGFPLSELETAWKYNPWEGFIVTGTVQWFEGGRVYWSERFGAHAVYTGNILNKFSEYEKWLQHEGKEMTGGILGFPIAEQQQIMSTTGAIGEVQRFIYGYIIDWSGGTFAIKQGFYDMYQSIGEWKSELGFPLTEEGTFISFTKNKGIIQYFENGCMHWNLETNQGFYLCGLIYKKWAENQGKMGLAINYARVTKNSLLQNFEGGAIESFHDGSVYIIK